MEGGTLQEAAEEEEAVDDAKAYAGRLGVHSAAELGEGAEKLLKAAARVFEGLAAARPCGPDSPTEEPQADDAQEEWGDLAARLARRQAAAAAPGQPRDPRVTVSALELQEDAAESPQPIPAFYVVKCPRGILRLRRADGFGINPRSEKGLLWRTGKTAAKILHLILKCIFFCFF